MRNYSDVIFEQRRNGLIRQWEDEYKRPWPTYPEAVPSPSGANKPRRELGDVYNGHHIIPLEQGGTNDWWNLIPLHVFDHADIHEVFNPFIIPGA